MYYVQPVAQLNINTTPSFEKALQRLMRLRGLTSKSEAVRLAVEEAAERAASRRTGRDFEKLWRLGLKVPQNPKPRFTSHDDLWK